MQHIADKCLQLTVLDARSCRNINNASGQHPAETVSQWISVSLREREQITDASAQHLPVKRPQLTVWTYGIAGILTSVNLFAEMGLQWTR